MFAQSVNSRLMIQDSRFTIHDLRFTITRFTAHPSPFTLLIPVFVNSISANWAAPTRAFLPWMLVMTGETVSFSACKRKMTPGNWSCLSLYLHGSLKRKPIFTNSSKKNSKKPGKLPAFWQELLHKLPIFLLYCNRLKPRIC